MYEKFDANKLTPDHFALLERIEKDHQSDLERAKQMNSLAVHVYKLC